MSANVYVHNSGLADLHHPALRVCRRHRLRGVRCELACCTFMDNDVAVLANRSLLAMTCRGC